MGRPRYIPTQAELINVNNAIDRLGSDVQAAKLLGGISHQAVGNWRTKGVPAERVLELERLSGVPRYLIRPDIYPTTEQEKDDDNDSQPASIEG